MTIALISGLIAFAVTSENSNQPDLVNATITSFGIISCVTMAALATYLYNDLYDIKSDSKNNRNIIVDVQYQYNVILGTTVFLFTFSGVIAFALNLFSGIACLVFIVLSIVYSHPATSLKDKFMVKTIITAAGASLASLIGIFSYSTSLESFVVLDILWSVPLLSFLFYFVLGPLGDISDFKGDKHANKITIPIKIGVENTFYFMFGVIFIISLVLIFLYVTYDVHIMTPIIGISLSLLLVSLLYDTKNNSDKQKIKHARKYSRWHLLGMLCSVLVGVLL